MVIKLLKSENLESLSEELQFVKISVEIVKSSKYSSMKAKKLSRNWLNPKN